MAWSRDRVDSSNINNGNEYQKGDRVSRQQLNAMVNAGLYSQDFVEALTETPVVNNEEVNANPTVNLIPYEKNGKQFYKFEFNNIKGKAGATGADGQSANISGATAEILNEGSNTPSIDVQLGGTPTDRTFHFIFKDILSGSTGPSALLYDELGDNTDGALTQKKSTEELNKKIEFDDEGFTEDLPTIQTQIDSLNSEIENLRKLLSVSSLPIGTIISSAIMQGSPNLHLLDGGELSIGGTYDAFCQFIIETYKRDNTSVPVTNLETYQSEIATYGQCGKFVITDTYVKLPKITKLVGGVENISDLAKINEAGLPNITGEIGKLGSRNTGTGPFFQTANGAFALKSLSGNIGYDTDSVSGTYNFNTTFDASRSNSIYGKSNTVETEYVKYPYYIVVATVTKTDIEINLDNVATDLNNKADKTGANIDKVEFNKNLQNDWINKYLRAVSSASNTSWITVDLYDYLGNTDGLFEVFVNIYLYNNVNANSAVYMYTDCVGDSTNYVETHYEWKYDTSRATFIMPIKRYLYIRKAQHNSGDSFRVDCFGYRRIK